MEPATRTFSKKRVSGLSKYIERYLSLGIDEIRAWKKIKDKGRILFTPECNGSYVARRACEVGLKQRVQTTVF
jgi:hypothetical protein